MDSTQSIFIYPDNVDFISGFGPGSAYELECQKIVVITMEYFQQNPSELQGFLKMKSYFDLGSTSPGLDKILNGMDLTGAMVGFSLNHAKYALENGWKEYINYMQEKRGG